MSEAIPAGLDDPKDWREAIRLAVDSIDRALRHGRTADDLPTRDEVIASARSALIFDERLESKAEWFFSTAPTFTHAREDIHKFHRRAMRWHAAYPAQILYFVIRGLKRDDGSITDEEIMDEILDVLGAR